MTERNWAEMGITWVTTEVSRQHGPNKTDRSVIGTGEIPQIESIDKAVAAGLGPAIMSGVNGTSWRVTAQDVIRSYIEGTEKSKRSAEELRERIYKRLQGMRNTAVSTREVVVAPLPNGEMWKGTDATEFESLYAAALVDAGMEATLALGIAANVAKPVAEKLAK